MNSEIEFNGGKIHREVSALSRVTTDNNKYNINTRSSHANGEYSKAFNNQKKPQTEYKTISVLEPGPARHLQTNTKTQSGKHSKIF